MYIIYGSSLNLSEDSNWKYQFETWNIIRREQILNLCAWEDKNETTCLSIKLKCSSIRNGYLKQRGLICCDSSEGEFQIGLNT